MSNHDDQAVGNWSLEIMQRQGLGEVYPLTFDTVNSVVPAAQAGVFALGYIDAQDRFCITFIGGSFDDLRQALFNQIATASQFKFRPCSSALHAFEAMCVLFHDFRPIGNALHPERHAGSGWTCPRCVLPARC
jgi:hypothetical protein